MKHPHLAPAFYAIATLCAAPSFAAPAQSPKTTPATATPVTPAAPSTAAAPSSEQKEARTVSQNSTEADASPVAEVASLSGKVYILRNGDKITVTKGLQLFASDQLMTSKNSIAKIVFADGSNFIVMQEGSIEIEDYWLESKGKKTTLKSALNVVRGKARFFFKPREGGVDATVKTANATMGIRGTVLFVDHPNREDTNIVVVDGSVAVRNPQKPQEEVVLKAKETTSVRSETPPEKPKPVPPEVMTTLVAQAQTPSDPFPDGQAPETLTLPPPRAPEVKKEEKPQGGVKLPYPETIVREVVTPQFMVVPLGANMVTRSQARCDRSSLDKLRAAASEFDSEAVVIGRELAQCPGMGDEALFWLAFYHRAAGESSRAIEASRFAMQEKTPLEVFTEREVAIQSALEGRTSELARYLRARRDKNGDMDAVLLLARTYARLGNFNESLNLYQEYLKSTKLASNIQTRIEVAYLLLLRSEFEKAEEHFYKLTGESMPTISDQAVARGLRIAQARIQKPSGSENNRVAVGLDIHNNGDQFDLSGPRFLWESHYAILDAQLGSLRYDGDTGGANRDETKYDFEYFHPRIGKTFTFSSGTSLKALIGMAQIGEYRNFSLETFATQQLKKEFSIFGAVNRAPYGIKELAKRDEIESGAIKTSVNLGGDWGRLFADRRYLTLAFTYDQIALEKSTDSISTTNLRVNTPIHKGKNTNDYLFATGSLEWVTASNQNATYYAPKSAITIGVGADYSVPFKLWREFLFSLPAQFLIVSRDASTAPEADSASDSNNNGGNSNDWNSRVQTEGRSKTRQYLKSETGFEVAPALSINVARSFDLYLRVKSRNLSNSTTGDQTWKENRIMFGLNWNYGRSKDQL